MYIHRNTHAQTHVHTHKHMYMQTHVQLYMHTHTHTHTYIHTHKTLQYFVVHSQIRVLHSRGRQSTAHTPCFAFTALSY
ncbi:unnamed protein product [Staurois parvus]|uniref:Uncharacterized protein n=1 Tax=Staurois parvus TaxID=386267 RepID=A0ABN9BPP9_9NEOB|nr:unnamed protein product [Staurois parvus]